jgi:hypothetical protein
MTEAQWQSCSDPEMMLEYLRGRVGDRKLRLFACACCRHLLTEVAVNPWDEAAVDVAERFADGEASNEELESAASSTTSDYTPGCACADAASAEGGVDAAIYAADNARHAAGEHAAFLVNATDDHPAFAAGRAAEAEAQARLLRDVFGNPFGPVTPDSGWLTSTVVMLAEGIYQQKAFDRLPILADALQEAGCDSERVLNHCRSEGPHVRGCWVIDMLTGRK